MSPLDPTCADVTAHVVEFLAELDPYNPALRRALDYLEKTQEADGSWYGRWGVNYLYGTGLVLAGLQAAGEIPRQPYPRHAATWLLSRQNPDGGWGETCYSYEAAGQRAVGPSSASQTAWALLGLMAAGETFGQSVQAGIDYLLRTQQEDGTWREEAYTGTGFPRAFYLKYELYPIYFPLIALARYRTYLMKTTQ
jgi:squalene-hopene/tetraprenyl-beta-curcumene cyclase